MAKVGSRRSGSTGVRCDTDDFAIAEVVSRLAARTLESRRRSRDTRWFVNCVGRTALPSFNAQPQAPAFGRKSRRLRLGVKRRELQELAISHT